MLRIPKIAGSSPVPAIGSMKKMTQKVFRFGGETAKMNVLEDLIKKRNRTADEIGELLSMRDSINSDIAEKQDRLQELNDEIEDEVQEAITREQEYLEVLKSDDYSTLAREYRRLNKEIYEGRKRGWYTFMENTAYPSEGELRQQRRDVGDRMLEMVDGK